jgi:RNA polymerase sigma factor, sigma-70 family
MDILQNKKQTYISYSDEDLFVMMSFREENEMEAQAAFRVFYDRYKKLLWNLCHRVCQNNKELAKDVFINTMMAVYQNSHTYNVSKSKITTWISNIAKHEMLDLLDVLKEKRIGEKTFVPLEDNLVISDIEENINIETPEKWALDEALQTLSEKERDVLLTYTMYQDGNKHLPDEVMKFLCDRYGTTSVNLRKIKQRTLEKVKSHILLNTHLLK